MLDEHIDDHITMRTLEQNDAAALSAAVDANRDHLGAFLPWVPNSRTVADSLAFIEETQQRIRDGKQLAAGIWLDGKLAGHIGLEFSGEGRHERGEIGYWLSRDATGRGIMTRGVKVLMDAAMTDERLTQFLIRARTDNRPSRAVAGRLGFRHAGRDVGVERMGGQTYDLERYELKLGSS